MTKPSHPDALGCNALCHGDVHCTTIISRHVDLSHFLASTSKYLHLFSLRAVHAVPCEMLPAQWWAQYVEKRCMDVRGIVKPVKPPSDLATFTVWRVMVARLEERSA